ncbi:MAG: NAD-dependent epimerase/dehydratase family protein [Bacteroidia bacterium]|nr:NAD-dependent epimerase/dehydratase family protein [Bacteroidia bacterium]
MKSPHILLTGASGSTAGNLLRLGTFAGTEISSISRSGVSFSGDSPFSSLLADLSVANPNDILPARADIVVHGAAIVPKKARSDADYQANVTMAENLARYAWDRRIGHLIFISTGSVYGPGLFDPIESTVCRPADAYGQSMRAAEEIFEKIRGKVPLTILRLYYPYGFDAQTPPDNLVAKIFLRIAQDQPLTLAEGQERAFFRPTFMPDLSLLLRWIMATQWTGTLNVAGPDEMTLVEMVQAMADLLGKTPQISYQAGLGLPGSAGIYLLKSLHAGFSWTSFLEGLPKAAKSLKLLPEDE